MHQSTLFGIPGLLARGCGTGVPLPIVRIDTRNTFLPVRQSDYRPDCQMEKQRIEIDPPFSDIITITWEDVPRFP